MTSQGLGSDQGRDMIFGYDPDQTVESIQIIFQNGKNETIAAPHNGALIQVSAN